MTTNEGPTAVGAATPRDKTTPRPWQQSAFVDGPRYAHMPDDWKAMKQAEEVLIVRGPGRLGSPECNPVLRLEWNTADAALIVEAVNDYDRLRRIEAAAREWRDAERAELEEIGRLGEGKSTNERALAATQRVVASTHALRAALTSAQPTPGAARQPE